MRKPRQILLCVFVFIKNTSNYKIKVKQMIFYARFPDYSSSLILDFYTLQCKKRLHYITIYVYVPHFYDLSALVGCWSSVSIRRIIYKFLNVCPFDYTAVAVGGKLERS